MRKLGPITKYFQFAGVIAGFVGLTLLRQVVDNNNIQPNPNNQLANIPNPNSLVLPSSTPVNWPTSTPTTVARKSPVYSAPPANTPSTTLNTPKSTPQSSPYKNGTFTGQVADAYYGNVQVQLVISSGKIAKVDFLQYPSDNRTSQFINGQAMPMLQQETIQAQSANINAISGASATSQAFYQSLKSALQQAQAA